MATNEREHLLKEIIAKRQFVTAEIVHVDFRDLKQHDKSQDRTFLSSYLPSLMLNDISGQLQQMDTLSGLEQLIDILYKGQMYHHMAAMPLRWVAELAAKFIAPFSDDGTRCYSNYDRSGKDFGSFTQATSDKGIIFIDDHLVGLLVVEEED